MVLVDCLDVPFICVHVLTGPPKLTALPLFPPPPIDRSIDPCFVKKPTGIPTFSILLLPHFLPPHGRSQSSSFSIGSLHLA